MTSESAAYHGHRFPAEVVHHATWLHHAFSLGLRSIELMLAERGVVVSHESIRRWCLRFGVDFAARPRKRRPRPGDTWHVDEVSLRINGELFYLWRAVDRHGAVLGILAQERRFKSPGRARRFLSAHPMTCGHFRPRRHPMSADRYRRARAGAFRSRRLETRVRTAVWPCAYSGAQSNAPRRRTSRTM